MNVDNKLFSIANYEVKINHILVFLIICLSFSITFLIRIVPGVYGWELNEFDPFFNYRATQYILDNGINSYFSWNDDLSWYPHGRDISSNSQVILHIITAIGYWIFGMGTDLYDFTIILPVILGSLTTIVIFLLVRLIGGTTAGLFASLLFSISTPILLRGMLGWFKSEPLGLFFGILSTYLFLSGLKNDNSKSQYIRILSSGVLTILAISAWGGSQFFIIPIGIFIFSLPFLSPSKSTTWKLLVFSSSLLLSSLFFERLAINFITGLNGLLIISSTIFAVLSLYLKNKFPEKNPLRILIISLIIFVLITIVFGSIFDSGYSHRYLNAINPLLTTTDPLVDSISEHQTTNIFQSFLLHSNLLLFSSIGVWLLFKNKFISKGISSKFTIFTLIFGLVGIYISSTFLRLEVFASISVIIFASIGLSYLITSISKLQTRLNKKLIFSSIFFFGLISLLLTPLFIIETNPVYVLAATPPTILNGGTPYPIATDDWISTLIWIKNNTNEDSVIASWWDYGYWIQTISERATIADNSTISTDRIQNIAEIFFDSPDVAWKKLTEKEADYFVLFVTAQRLPQTYDGNRLYLIGDGGDESKKYWFLKIANLDPSDFLESDYFSGNERFWNDTTLGKMIPYSILGYTDPNTNQDYLEYVPGTVGIYKKEIKFSENDPFNLVYASPSFFSEQSGPALGVFVYQINKEYSSINLDSNISP